MPGGASSTSRWRGAQQLEFRGEEHEGQVSAAAGAGKGQDPQGRDRDWRHKRDQGGQAFADTIRGEAASAGAVDSEEKVSDVNALGRILRREYQKRSRWLLFHGEGRIQQLRQLFQDGRVAATDWAQRPRRRPEVSGSSAVEADDRNVEARAEVALQLWMTPQKSHGEAPARRPTAWPSRRTMSTTLAATVTCAPSSPDQSTVWQSGCQREGLVKDNSQRFGHGEGWSGGF